ncbi:alpha-beta hydrolase superfamily lysophospholipase [Actinokineospora auranticolor]|uniref:Alpha-beta hydrolase superfamily lysophospholipase n=1 Tax=Actinokineospora auranticolor TaxID=155976 RepID=A0A2S6GDJ6_9PSEU|nr:alpha-beta hydrolase superfamily lysophospholipase [Actinokineospora auranticolor]
MFLPANQVWLHAAVWRGPGQELPPLLVLHGIWESWRTFAPLAGALAGHRAVYCLDLRGHGLSDRPDRGYRFTDYAADVLALVDGLSSRFGETDLLGHSLGANVALYAAAEGHPALGRVVVVDPPILLDDDWAAVRADMRRSWELARAPLADIVADLGRGSRRDPTWLRMIAAALSDTADGVFAAMVEGEQGAVDWPSLLAPVTAPVLAVAPDPTVPGGLLVGDRLAVFHRSLPHAEITRITGAGHHVEVDRPDELRCAVDRFLSADRPGRLSGAA